MKPGPDDLKPLVRKKKRMLSRFLAQELLFDYVTDGLDRERREALEAYLPTCTETQRQLHNLKMGLEICGQLRRIQVSDPSIEAIANARSPVQKILHGLKPNHWPEYIQWSAEAILVAACLGGLVLFVPWQKISRILPKRPSDITLVEVKKQTEPLPNEPHPVESVKVAAETTAPSTPEPPANQEAEAPAQETETAAAEPPSPEDQKAPGPLEEDTQVAHQGPMKGVLYRAFMASDDSTDITREIRDIITALGGKKAGRVELGWRKPGGSYYHFTLPESNFDELQERLKALGPVRIAKEAHSRVMPAGKIRIILWVEEKSLAQ